MTVSMREREAVASRHLYQNKMTDGGPGQVQGVQLAGTERVQRVNRLPGSSHPPEMIAN